MANYRSRQMRLLDNEEKRMIRRIILAVVATVFIIVAVFFGGIPTLLSIGSVFSIFKQDTTAQTNDNTPLIAPKIEPIENATNSATIRVAGVGQEGTTVMLYVNDNTVDERLVGKDAEFAFDKVLLKEGQNTIYAQAKTSDGKQSPASTKLQILFDKTPPKLEVSSPKDNEQLGDVKEVKVTGKTEPAAFVTINDSIAVVNQDGVFSLTLPFAGDELTIQVSASDVAGNKMIVERKVRKN